MNLSMTRDLTVPGQKRSLRYLLQSIICLELLSPSNPLWVSSGWMSDIPLMDNSARQFQALYFDWEPRWIRLSECLEAICDRGGRVAVVLRDEEHNTRIVQKLRAGPAHARNALAVILTRTQHVKGLVGSHCMIGGSMNFTFNGIQINDEEVIYRCDQASIQEKRLSLNDRWGHELPWGNHG
jgi:hypothetical protein